MENEREGKGERYLTDKKCKKKKMELLVMSAPSSCLSFSNTNNSTTPMMDLKQPTRGVHIHSKGRNRFTLVSYALPETAASVVIAATLVGAAATLLVRRNKAASEAATEVPLIICEDCGGSGICSVCKGEGFVLKRLSEQSAEKARLTAKNMATRYTAGLPKKWSYCTRCSSSRSCTVCGGRGKLS